LSDPDELTAVVGGARAVIFDLFHTLTSASSTWIGGPTTADILGFSDEEWTRRVFQSPRDRLVGIQRDPVAIMTELARSLDPTISDEVIQRAAARRLERFERALTKIPQESIDVLTELRARHKKTGLISNADVTEVAAWDKSPLAPLFDSTIMSCHVGHAKPDREIYDLSLKELGVGPGEAVFVGDGGSRELEGAQRVGMKTVMMIGVIKDRWPQKMAERREHADYVVDSLTELL
jgi:putative hydrolase of the HAD superfamily